MDALKYLSNQIQEERKRMAEDLADGMAKDTVNISIAVELCEGC